MNRCKSPLVLVFTVALLAVTYTAIASSQQIDRAAFVSPAAHSLKYFAKIVKARHERVCGILNVLPLPVPGSNIALPELSAPLRAIEVTLTSREAERLVRKYSHKGAFEARAEAMIIQMDAQACSSRRSWMTSYTAAELDGKRRAETIIKKSRINWKKLEAGDESELDRAHEVSKRIKGLQDSHLWGSATERLLKSILKGEPVARKREVKLIHQILSDMESHVQTMEKSLDKMKPRTR